MQIRSRSPQLKKPMRNGSNSPRQQQQSQQGQQSQSSQTQRNFNYFEDIHIHKTDKKFQRNQISPSKRSGLNKGGTEGSSMLPQINQSLSDPKINKKKKDTDGYNVKRTSKQINTELMGQVTRLSNVIYILGNLSSDLIYFIENQQKMQTSVSEFIEKMKAPQFLELQQGRTNKLMNLFQKFIIEIALSNQKEKEGCREIGEIMKREMKQIFVNHENYIQNQEENLQRVNMFQNKEVMLVTDFYEGVRMILDTYNYMYKEMGSYGKTRPAFENYVKSIHQFKSLLAAEEKNQRAYKLINDLEGLVRSQFERIDNQEIQIENLKNENEKLTHLYEQYQQQKQEWSLKKLQFLKHEIETQEKIQENQTQAKYGLKKKGGGVQDINTTHIRSLEEFYINTVNDLKQENKRISQQLYLANKKISSFNQMQTNKETELNNEKAQEQKQEKLKKQFQSLNRAHKEIQCCFIQEKNPITKRDNAFMNIILNPNSYLKFGTLQSREWIQCIINVMYQDKILSEVPDQHDKRPKSKLQVFVAQWFLKKFGNKDVAEILLKDFLLTLKKYGKQSERYNMFADFCELDELLDPDFESSNINTIGINKLKFKKVYMSTQEPIKIYLRLAYFAKTTAAYGQQSTYMPLLPNILVRGMDLVSFETVQKMLEVLQSEEPSYEQIEGFQNSEQLYRKFLAQDMGNRAREGLKVYNDVIEEDEDQYIRFDFLAKNLIDIVLEKRFLELEALYISLQQKGTPKYPCSINYEDFKKLIQIKFPAKTSRWIEIAYKTFMDAVMTDKTPIGIPILKLIPLIVNDDCLQENMLRIKHNILYNTESGNLPGTIPVLQQQDSKKKDNNPLKPKGGGAAHGNKQQPSVMNSTLITEQFTSQQKEEENKKLFQAFDHIMEVALLEETYKIVTPLITAEKKNESLNRAHETFKEEVAKLPKDVIQMQKYSLFTDTEKTKQAMKESIDNSWVLFRKILGQLSQNK